jgi:hypothetical protein
MIEYVNCGLGGMTSGLGGLGGGGAISDFLRFFELVFGFGGAVGFVVGAGAGGGGEWDVREDGGECERISTDGERGRVFSY